MFDRPQQVGVFLTHDAVEARGAHPRVLHLLERPSGIDSLMLADIADDEYSILRSDLFKEVAHLPGAGQTRLVEHVEMPAAVATVGLIPSPAGEESLQRRGMDTRVAKLARRPRSRSKTPLRRSRRVPRPRGSRRELSFYRYRPAPAGRRSGRAR